MRQPIVLYIATVLLYTVRVEYIQLLRLLVQYTLGITIQVYGILGYISIGGGDGSEMGVDATIGSTRENIENWLRGGCVRVVGNTL